MSERTPTPWWTDTEGRGDQQHNVICGSLDAHGTQVVVDDLNAGYLLDPEERHANAAFIVKAVNNHEALVAMLEDARLQLEYMQEKHSYATGETVLARIRGVLASVSAPGSDANG